MPFWDERFREMSARYGDVKTAQYHIDILCAHFVQHPDWFDVVVGSNLFGDILSDLGPAVAGSIGIAASANINPEGRFPSMFEPVHGSAPDIAGQHICNPIGQIWSAALMLEHLGQKPAADAIVDAIEVLLGKGGPRTRDIGGQAMTNDIGGRLQTSSPANGGRSRHDLSRAGCNAAPRPQRHHQLRHHRGDPHALDVAALAGDAR